MLRNIRTILIFILMTGLIIVLILAANADLRF